MKRIDPHVHPRPDIEIVAKLAKEQGMGTILVMPEKPEKPDSLLREKDLKDRLFGIQRKKLGVNCFFYVGLTSDEGQIEEAVKLVRNYPEAVGLKLYPPENEKKKIFKVLAKLGYSGVLAVHAEKASLFKPELFNPEKPGTHNLAQSPETEIASIKETIEFAEWVHFLGVLYILHITLPESAEIIWQAKKRLNIYSEVTPHHLLLSAEQMQDKRDLLFKVNPPLREKRHSRALAQAVKSDMVDCIGTDYAYHPLGKKFFPPYSSGIARYELYNAALDFLRKQGMSEEAIDSLTYWNIKKVFRDKLGEV